MHFKQKLADDENEEEVEKKELTQKKQHTHKINMSDWIEEMCENDV